MLCELAHTTTSGRLSCAEPHAEPPPRAPRGEQQRACLVDRMFRPSTSIKHLKGRSPPFSPPCGPGAAPAAPDGASLALHALHRLVAVHSPREQRTAHRQETALTRVMAHAHCLSRAAACLCVLSTPRSASLSQRAPHLRRSSVRDAVPSWRARAATAAMSLDVIRRLAVAASAGPPCAWSTARLQTGRTEAGVPRPCVDSPS